MKKFLLALILAAAAGCASIGVQAPSTPAQKVLAARATVTAVANSAIALRQAGKLSDADKASVVGSLKAAEQGIDIADQTGDMDRLSASIAILSTLNTYLATKGK
jgi:hypothetical protein